MDTAVGTKTTGPYTEITHRIAHTHNTTLLVSEVEVEALNQM